MTLLQELRAKADLIGKIGAEARAEARALGAPSYYVDANIGDGIVEELSDGSKRLTSLKTSSGTNNDQAA